MSILEDKKNVFFSVAEEHVAKAFGPSIHLTPSPGGSRLTTILATGEDGGDIRCFDPGERTWDVMEEDDIHVNIAHDGMVHVRYSKEEQIDRCMTFKVGHPREVAELFHLLVDPAHYVTPEEEVTFGTCTIGEIFDLYALIPDGATWRILNPSALPSETTDDVLKAFYFNINRDWDNFISGKTFEAFRFTEQWPDFVRSLPVATEYLRTGYLLHPEGDLLSAVDLVVTPPTNRSTFITMLAVPSRKDVSSMYVREFLNGDSSICKSIRKSFTPAETLDAFMSAIKATKLQMPKEYHHQIRIAAEHSALRQWLLYVAERLATQRGCYLMQDKTHWHLAITLNEMVDMSQIAD
jgi:hypothetical protein